MLAMITNLILFVVACSDYEFLDNRVMMQRTIVRRFQRPWKTDDDVKMLSAIVNVFVRVEAVVAVDGCWSLAVSRWTSKFEGVRTGGNFTGTGTVSCRRTDVQTNDRLTNMLLCIS